MDPGPHAEVVLRLDYAEMAWRNGDPAVALASAREILESEDELPPALSQRARRLVAIGLEKTGDYPGAIAELEVLAAELTRDREWIALVMDLCRCYLVSGQSARAIDIGHRAEVDIEQLGLGDNAEAIRLSVTVAGAHLEHGDLRYGLHLCERAAEKAEAIGSDIGLASAYWNASVSRLDLGEVPVAVSLAERALAIFQSIGDTRSKGRLHANLVLMLLQLNPPDVGAAELHAAQAEINLQWSEASLVEQARVLHVQARVAYARGDLEAAAQRAAECHRLVADRAPSLAADCCLLLGNVALTRGRRDDARRHVEQAVLLLAASGKERDIARAWFELGGLLQELGDIRAAIDAYRRAAVTTGVVRPEASALAR